MARRVLYVTLSDSDFAPRTIAMLESLRKFDSASELLFVTIGDFPKEEVEAINFLGIPTTPIQDIISKSVYYEITSTRSVLSAFWTFPSVIISELINKDVNFSDIVYLDADLYFYGDVQECWEEIPLGNLAIVRHNFSKRLERIFTQSGEFNVSWVSFPNDEFGKFVADVWAEQCLADCPDTPIVYNGKLIYGDQGYLDDWPTRYGKKLTQISHKGVGVAPWNYENYSFSCESTWKVDDSNLIFYHFSSHQFGFVFARRMGSEYSKVKSIPVELYREYEDHLRQIAKSLGKEKWRSRYTPLSRRCLNYLSRLIKKIKWH